DADGQDGIKIPSAKYRLPIEWTWLVDDGVNLEHGQEPVSAHALVWQPQAFADHGGHRPLPELTDDGPPAVPQRVTVYTPAPVSGVGRLKKQLSEALAGLPARDSLLSRGKRTVRNRTGSRTGPQPHTGPRSQSGSTGPQPHTGPRSQTDPRPQTVSRP